ncbi:hypothetical protein HI914_07221 [Erysiphe necator]|nr:hypothetical protein HI914_07221 [Erysiphe necator]
MAPTLIWRDLDVDRVSASKHSSPLELLSKIKSVCLSLEYFFACRRAPGKQELRRRQINDSPTTIIPTTYKGLNDGPSAAAVVGIVLGSIGGILTIFWIFYVCCILRDYGDIRPSSPNISFRRSARRKHSSNRHTQSRAKKTRSHHQPKVKGRRRIYAVSSASASRSIPRSSRHMSHAGADSFVRYPSAARRPHQRDSISRGSNKIVVIEEPDQPSRGMSGGRSRSSRESRRSRDITGQSMHHMSIGGKRSSIGRASR